jgi:RimJ/RimL family protein N-acetyltransferase
MFRKALHAAHQQLPLYLALIIEEKSTGKKAGIMGIININYDKSQAEIGILLNREFHGKRLPIQFTKATLNYVFHELKLNSVYVDFNSKNIPILRIVKQLGFHKLTDTNAPSSVIYSIKNPALETRK